MRSLDFFQFTWQSASSNSTSIVFHLWCFDIVSRMVNCLCCSVKVFTQSRSPHVTFQATGFSIQLFDLTKSSGPQPDNLTVFSPLLLEAKFIRLSIFIKSPRFHQNPFFFQQLLWLANYVRFMTWTNDSFLKSDNTIMLVLISSSENLNPNSALLSDFGAERAAISSSEAITKVHWCTK